ncbi:hypothetical protein ACIBBD_10970 [Streptomyces sp. NPDC051315]|uniref:hypothetical protein n=1 Tax=Streptomyces sp. NPDC051315 TaxID=3365650 RepID=UPI0037959520
MVRPIPLGHSNAEIAAGPYVSPSAVEARLSSVRLTRDARNRVEAAARAWQQHGHVRSRG